MTTRTLQQLGRSRIPLQAMLLAAAFMIKLTPRGQEAEAAETRRESPILAQQMPPGPGSVGPIRRGQGGRIEPIPGSRDTPRETPGSVPGAKAGDDQEEAQITLPPLLAIELPNGVLKVAPDTAPLKSLLESAASGRRPITHDLKNLVGPGAYRVTWTAWADTPGGQAATHKSATIFVFPFGQTPVGVSADDHATAANNATKVVRDAWGRVHMAWLDGGRPNVAPGVMYRRAATGLDGAVTWETPPLRVNDARSEAWSAYLGIAASANAVHIAWQANGTIRYRRLLRSGDDWAFEPIRDTAARSDGHDVGPAVAAASDDEVHVIGPAGSYAISRDGGARWLRAEVPIPPGMRAKSTTLALDAAANAHVAFTGVVRGPSSPSEHRASNGYWELRYVRRTAAGAWVDAQNALLAVRDWQAPRDNADILADFTRLAIDGASTLHLVWHGTARTRIYGNDEAYYTRRDAEGAGKWHGWTAPQILQGIDKANNVGFSYAPSLALDDNAAISVTFHEVLDRGRPLGYDSAARIVRRGAAAGPLIPVTQFVQTALAAGRPDQALSTWFPSAAPAVYRDRANRAWLDVLLTLEPAAEADSPKLIVYCRLDVTQALAVQR